jgi:hypothetical protein
MESEKQSLNAVPLPKGSNIIIIYVLCVGVVWGWLYTRGAAVLALWAARLLRLLLRVVGVVGGRGYVVESRVGRRRSRVSSKREGGSPLLVLLVLLLLLVVEAVGGGRGLLLLLPMVRRGCEGGCRCCWGLQGRAEGGIAPDAGGQVPATAAATAA